MKDASYFFLANGANVYTRILDSDVPTNKCTSILFSHLLRYQIPLSPVPCLNASQTIKRKKSVKNIYDRASPYFMTQQGRLVSSIHLY